MSPSSTPPDDDPEDEGYFDPAWLREANGYGTFKPDKTIAERGFVEDALTGSSIAYTLLVSHQPDPPDCTALVDEKPMGIEVTELVDREILAALIKARRKAPEVVQQLYREWTQEDFLAHLQAIIGRKSKGLHKWTGGPYERRMLVIHTDEMWLTKETVASFLEGLRFKANGFSDVVLVLPCEPLTDAHYPAFSLTLDG